MASIAEKEFKDIEFIDIYNWCVENNETAWLKAEGEKTTIAKRHTERKQVTNKNGKKVWVADKKSPKVEVEIPITFVEIKKDFLTKFMPEKLPVAKEKEPTMFDLIAAL